MTSYRGKILLFMVLVFPIAIMCLYLRLQRQMNIYSFVMQNEIKTNREAYLVETPDCRIPNLNPFDISVRHLIKAATSRTCLTDSNFTFISNMTIYVNWPVIKFSNYHSTFSHCTFQGIERPEDNTDLSNDFVKVSNESKIFNYSIEFQSEFIRVKCFDITNKLIYTNFYCIVIEKLDVERRKAALHEASRSSIPTVENFNILMIGIDSVSRLNSIRYMNKTRNFLLNTLNATELIGYNKVADNTFVNIVPMIAGKFVEELPWDESLIHEPFDKYQFIWKDFASRGYRTLFVEDAPEMAMFDFMKGGFIHAPTDYYNRHFALTMEEAQDVWFDDHNCVMEKLETKLYLDYVRDFAFLMKDKPHFGISFMTRLTHTGSIEDVGAADDPYLDFFQHLHSTNNLNNTVIFFFSDHGTRFGNIRKTFHGKLEERLPFMFIVFPHWFHNKYPLLSRNIRLNAQRLATPFDIYDTLKDILFFSGKNVKNYEPRRSISLLSEVHFDRTCKNAGILPHWCTCLEFVALSKSNQSVIQAANFLINSINNRLGPVHNICVTLSIEAIDSAFEIVPSETLLRFDESKHDVIAKKVVLGDRVDPVLDYQLSIRTRPGNGTFEATVRHNEEYDEYQVMGDISRTNMYGNQSHCVNTSFLKKYCFCKQNNL